MINHNFHGSRNQDEIIIDGEYDVNIWYSSFDDSKTDVIRQHDTYHEIVHMKNRDSNQNEEIIVRSLKQPNCVKIDIDQDKIHYTIEKELGIELVGDIKVKVEANLEEDPWDEIMEEEQINQNTEEINQVKENFIEDTL